MAGSLAPKGSFGMPSPAQRHAGRAAWRAASVRTKVGVLGFWIVVGAGFAAGLIFLALGHSVAFVVTLAVMLALVALGAVISGLAAVRHRRRPA